MSKIPSSPVVRASGILLFTEAPPSESKRSDRKYSESKRFLLMRHSNRWDLPKGHCDGDESFHETAMREMEEETGIPPLQIRLDPTFEFDMRYPVTYRQHGPQVFQKHVRYFLAQLRTEGEECPGIQVTEHESYQWFAWNPPHQIQSETIDPLLAAVAQHWGSF